MKENRQMDYRKIDALVAEHVMECEFYISGEDVRIKLDDTDIFACFSPSKNILAAWLVMEKKKKEDYVFHINIHPNHSTCEIYKNIDGAYNFINKCKAETAPLAICIASLRLKGIDIDE